MNVVMHLRCWRTVSGIDQMVEKTRLGPAHIDLRVGFIEAGRLTEFGRYKSN